jgi:hypothetical protein
MPSIDKSVLSNPDYDPYWGNVVLECHFDGADGDTTFIDSTGNHTCTGYMNTTTKMTKLVTSVRKFGTACLQMFPSGGQYGVGYSGVQFSNPTFTLGSNDFTFECWVNRTNLIAGQIVEVIYSGLDYSNGSTPLAVYLSSNATQLTFKSKATILNFPYNFALNTWYHIAISRNGNFLRAFVNGVMLGSAQAFSGVIPIYPSGWHRLGDVYQGRFLMGYYDELRLTNGVGRYTANFTPQTYINNP